MKAICIEDHIKHLAPDHPYADHIGATVRRHVHADIGCTARLAGLGCAPAIDSVWCATTSRGEFWAVLLSDAGEAVAHGDEEAARLPDSMK